jgi:hypothetical protein
MIYVFPDIPITGYKDDGFWSWLRIMLYGYPAGIWIIPYAVDNLINIEFIVFL